MTCAYCDESGCHDDMRTCEGCHLHVHDYCARADGWINTDAGWFCQGCVVPASQHKEEARWAR